MNLIRNLLLSIGLIGVFAITSIDDIIETHNNTKEKIYVFNDAYSAHLEDLRYFLGEDGKYIDEVNFDINIETIQNEIKDDENKVEQIFDKYDDYHSEIEKYLEEANL